MTILAPPSQTFRHEALLYAGDQEYLDGTLPFIRSALAADDPVLVVVSPAKIELLRSELGSDADRVCFAEMDAVGRNPARIIPAWREFVDNHRGRTVWGIGEPIFPSRSPAEMVECHRHESLLNLAFADAAGFWLLCPYDTESLDPAVIDEAHRNHPFMMEPGCIQRDSETYTGLEAVASPFGQPLPDPPVPPRELSFRIETLGELRGFVRRQAAAAGMNETRTTDVMTAVNEVASNSVRHAGGWGILRIWREGDSLVCEVRDDGHIDKPLVGREQPVPDQIGGYGLWMANQLCELVQLRSQPTGSVVRLHLDLHA